nr:EOG090X0MWD [Macrothrix elegans]
MSEKDTEAKIQEYETFVNEVLKNKLKICLKNREICSSEIQEYMQLRNSINNLSHLDTNPLKTKIDIGCGFFVDAEVPEVSTIFVSVGFGFFLELRHSEAVEFITKKISLLNDRMASLEKESADISSDIKSFLKTLGQLQGLVSTSTSM